MTRSFAALALFLAVTAMARPQQVGQNANPAEPQSFTLTVNSNLVVEAVTVKDKQGNFIHGLTADEFELTENGVPQTIRYCEHQDLSQTAKLLPASTPRNENTTIYDRLVRSQIASESLDKERYKNRRLLAFYFDMTALPPADQMRSLSAAEQFIRTQMTTADMIAIPCSAFSKPWLSVKDKELPPVSTTPAPPIPAPPSARTIPSSTSLTPTGSSPHSKLRLGCWAE
jgi:hypothetical protein